MKFGGLKRPTVSQFQPQICNSGITHFTVLSYQDYWDNLLETLKTLRKGTVNTKHYDEQKSVLPDIWCWDIWVEYCTYLEKNRIHMAYHDMVPVKNIILCEFPFMSFLQCRLITTLWWNTVSFRILCKDGPVLHQALLFSILDSLRT